MKKNLLNKQLIKAISLGISASMALQPVTALANDSVDPIAPENAGVEKQQVTGVQAVDDAAEESVNANTAFANSVSGDNGVAKSAEAVDGLFNANEPDKISNADLNTFYNNNKENINKDVETVKECSNTVSGNVDTLSKDAKSLSGTEKERNEAVTILEGTANVNEAAKNADEAFDNVSETIDAANDKISNAKTQSQAQEVYDEAAAAVKDAEEKLAQATEEFNSKKAAYEDALKKANEAQKAYSDAMTKASKDAEEAAKNLLVAKKAAEQLKNDMIVAKAALDDAEKKAKEAGELDVEGKNIAASTAKVAYDAEVENVNKLNGDIAAGKAAVEDLKTATDNYNALKSEKESIINAGVTAKTELESATTAYNNLKTEKEKLITAGQNAAKDVFEEGSEAATLQNTISGHVALGIVTDDVNHNRDIAFELIKIYNPGAIVERTDKQDFFTPFLHYFAVKINGVEHWFDFETDKNGQNIVVLERKYIEGKFTGIKLPTATTWPTGYSKQGYISECNARIAKLSTAKQNIISAGSTAAEDLKTATENYNTLKAGKDALISAGDTASSDLATATTDYENFKAGKDALISAGETASSNLSSAKNARNQAETTWNNAVAAADLAAKTKAEYEKVREKYNALKIAADTAVANVNIATTNLNTLKTEIEMLVNSKDTDETKLKLAELTSQYSIAMKKLENANTTKETVEKALEETKNNCETKKAEIQKAEEARRRAEEEARRNQENNSNDGQNQSSDSASEYATVIPTVTNTGKKPAATTLETAEVLGAKRATTKKATKVTKTSTKKSTGKASEEKEDAKLAAEEKAETVEAVETTETVVTPSEDVKTTDGQNVDNSEATIADEQTALADSVENAGQKHFPWIVVAILGVLGISVEEVVRRGSKKAKEKANKD